LPDKNFNHYLGIRLTQTHADGVTMECLLGKKHLNFAGVLHGGVTAALADVAVGQALMKRGYKCTTVELKISYLRAVTGRKVTARSHLLRIGKTLCIGRVDVFDQEKKLAAVAIVTYMLLDTGTYVTKPRKRRGSTV
jgi:acyl-CoA thioesterase